MKSTANIQGVNMPLLATPIKTNSYEIGNIAMRANPMLSFLRIRNDKKLKRKKSKKNKKFQDRIKDIENNYLNDMRQNSYLMSYGPGAIGF